MKIENQFNEILVLIISAKQNAFHAVNTELINLYWNIGKYICEKINSSGWGKSVVETLSKFIYKHDPNLKGFSPQNLWRMKQFYDIYSRNKKLSPVVREIHPKSSTLLKDNYVLDFLSLPKSFTEKDLRKSIVQNLKHFILEFGKDIAFVGEEYRVQVGNKDFYIDLLFFHRELQCLVAFDLKTTDFKPEYLGKMEFYLEALDRDVKKEYEKSSVGIVLCKNKDTQVVEYALSRSVSPTLVSQYETKIIDKKLLEQKLDEFYSLAKSDEY